MAAPRRTCVGCRTAADQAELTRFVLVGGVLTADPGRQLPGRGAWLHPRASCLEQAVRRGGFARSFRTRVDAEALLATHWPDGAQSR